VIVAVLLPPVLMMSRSLISAVLPEGNTLRFIAEFLGDPVMALLVALFYAIFVLGLAQGADMGRILEILNACLAPVAAIILIVGAGGGFKQMLIATKIGDMIGHWAAGAHVSPLLLGWSAAALVRIATGSATVATITGAGIAAPIIQADPTVNKELMVLATGSGSLILSHVNDAGFWLVKEYFGLTLPETFKSWTLMETILSVLGLVFSLLLGLVVH
jgi:gluconate:H+ symporter, GntP family